MNSGVLRLKSESEWMSRAAVAADMMDSSGEFRASGSPQSVVVFVEKTTPNLVSG
jgi:hypothetical protein